MAITAFQRRICQQLARSRIESGESYVARGVALNTLLDASRISRDIDLFHDTKESLVATWDSDRALLEQEYDIEIIRERPSFVEAVVRHGCQSVVMEWACDSAYRFFPLVEHPDFGLTLHPFDLATNKVLALVGRLEVRDWIDVIGCSEKIQHLGYLAWAACGKDPGYNPSMILAEASRTARYSQREVSSLAFDGTPPTAAELSARWRTMLQEGRSIVDALPADRVGCCVLSEAADLFHGDVEQLCQALARGTIRFHAGTIRGTMPRIVR